MAATMRTGARAVSSVAPKPATTRLVTYGCNSSGALGRGELGTTGHDAAEPVAIQANDPPVQVAAGWGHTAFVTASGALVTMGRAYDMRNVLRFGRLASDQPNFCYFWTQYLGGKGSIDFPEPTLMSQAPPKCVSIAASAGLTLALTEDGNALAFGANRYGQTGVADAGRQAFVFNPSPVKRPDGSAKWVKIAAGHQGAAAIDDKGSIYAWGKSDRGQVGCGDDTVKDSPVRVPRRIPAFTDGVKDVACGFSHVLALSNSGEVFVWGKNQADHGRANQNVPRIVSKLPPIAKIACGQFHSVALDVDGKVWQWGMRPSEMGGGFVDEPRLISGTPSHISDLSCGMVESCAVSDGVAYSWTWQDPRPKPIATLESFNVLQVSFGWKHVAALVQ